MTGDSELLTAFVNERAVRVPRGAPLAAAVRARDPELLASLEHGSAYLTDGRGIRVGADDPVTAGAIIRVVVSARRAREPDAHS